MKSVTLFLFISASIFSQSKFEKELKMPNSKSDSLSTELFGRNEFKNKSPQKDSLTYKLLVKPVEDPQIYSVLTAKPKADCIPIPNTINKETLPFELIEKHDGEEK